MFSWLVGTCFVSTGDDSGDWLSLPVLVLILCESDTIRVIGVVGNSSDWFTGIFFECVGCCLETVVVGALCISGEDGDWFSSILERDGTGLHWSESSWWSFCFTGEVSVLFDTVHFDFYITSVGRVSISSCSLVEELETSIVVRT